jgi:hypothetical protein
MSKRKYFSWTDELRAELREYVDTHKKNKTEALKEAAEVFGVSLGSCNGAYAYEPKKPIVTEVDPEDLEPREGRITKTYMKAKFNDMKVAEQSPVIAEIGRLQDELDESYKQQEEMLEEIRRWVSRAIQGFSNIEMTAGGITLQDVDYHLNALVRVMKHQYGHKPKLVEE